MRSETATPEAVGRAGVRGAKQPDRKRQDAERRALVGQKIGESA